MLESILSVIGVIFLSISTIFAWSFLLKKKINFKDCRLYVSIVLFSVLLVLNYDNVNKSLKFVIITILISIFVKFIFKTSLKNSIVTASYTQILNILLELIYTIIVFGVLKVQIDKGIYPILIVFFADLFVGIFCIILAKLKIFQKIYNLIISVTNKLSLKFILISFIPIIFLFNVYLSVSYFQYNALYFIIANTLSLFLIISIIFILFRKENEYTKIYDKYNTTLNSLKEYEDILDKYRVSNHENKNQLLTIRSMLVEKDKKTAKYIDGLVKNKIKDDERIMQEVSIIPAGGLRGLIYSKILDMKEKSIEYELNLSKEIRTVDLINNLNDSVMLDICQIVGVYIDNAVEAVVNINDKYVNIDMYLENNCIVFEITNYYEGNIDLEKLEEKGYTTKSNGHGYGLSLTKEIISKNKKLKNEKRVSKETFTQILKIKMK